MGSVEVLFHAGDYLRDVRSLILRHNIPIIGVAGNCDYPRHPEEEIVELFGQRFFVTHGHTLGVKSGRRSLVRAARRAKCDVAIYGHTHVPALFMENGILFVNPGSTSQGRSGTPPSCAVLTIEGSAIHGALMVLPKLVDERH